MSWVFTCSASFNQEKKIKWIHYSNTEENRLVKLWRTVTKKTQFEYLAILKILLLLLSRSVLSDSLRPHGLQHARLPCPSLSPGVCSNSCPLSRFLNFSSVVSDYLWPQGLQHARPPCPSPTPRIYSNSCPLSRWCHPTISSSVIPVSLKIFIAFLFINLEVRNR